MATILLVDDDPSLVESVTDLLSAEGYSLLSARDGEEGYRKARENAPDLILLDVMMTHNREGFDIARRLKEDETTCGIPVIIITGIRKAMRLPFSYDPDDDWLPVKAVLEKPVDPEHLIQYVRDALA